MQTVVGVCMGALTLGFVIGWTVFQAVFAYRSAIDFGRDITRND